MAAGFANTAIDLALAGKSGEMVGGLAGSEILSRPPLADVMGVKKTVPPLDYLNKQLKLLEL